MDVQFLINNSAAPTARYVSWAPSQCTIRVTNPAGIASGPVRVKLSNRSTTGGQLVFYAPNKTKGSSSITLKVPLDGQSVSFRVGGRFGRASIADGDAGIRASVGTTVVAELPLMVRVRKNANTLTASERDRFVSAFARLNDQGLGRFADFRMMHTNAASPEAHGAPGFLPWHRAYLLDLERELQALDPSVSLPYWRFDRAAPNLFTADFIGVSNANGGVAFSPGNPLQFWRTDGVQGVTRRPLFDTATEPGIGLLSEQETLALGDDYAAFEAMEGNPHGSAHVSFGGSISSIGTAARDPLFFLLHANVDRLWAKWQRQFKRFDASVPESFDSNANGGGNRVGHNLSDTMWPWNGVTGSPRPPAAPGGTLAGSPCATAPGPQPAVRDMLDFQGRLSATSRLGYDYDDVRYP